MMVNLNDLSKEKARLKDLNERAKSIKFEIQELSSELEMVNGQIESLEHFIVSCNGVVLSRALME